MLLGILHVQVAFILHLYTIKRGTYMRTLSTNSIIAMVMLYFH